MTIDQGSGQADPSGTSPIVFDVVFSEPVTGFETGDVLLSGTADPTVGVVVPVSSTVYTVEVGGMSLSGTVIAAVPADVAADGTGEPERRVDVDG
ncbi:hypothetical protein WBQ80_08405 [Agromyces sp. CCNWLW213]|uniref:hypothetical protein n=1 Tax=Agromyces sp. CCNWLW213 TaxID=3128541 RepID=UPI0030760793